MLQNVWVTDKSRHNKTFEYSNTHNRQDGLAGEQVKLSAEQIRESLSNLRWVKPTVVVEEAPVTRSAAPLGSPTTVAVLSAPPSAPLTPATPSTVPLRSCPLPAAQATPAPSSPTPHSTGTSAPLTASTDQTGSTPLTPHASGCASPAADVSAYFSEAQTDLLRKGKVLHWKKFYNFLSAPHLWSARDAASMRHVLQLLDRILAAISPEAEKAPPKRAQVRRQLLQSIAL
jgi:hypothetical protein